ncbi:FAD/NAD(P)-binding protein [Pseudomonas sp. dw_358]|uniref:FAD/NAD(P)-binding protein n=1 Tax=Pseudomonas sp. dw_358 TaxID=2720083 RepID=UPI001BD529E4|nr:FAD/NAD(P)-binding protein [Pseudomonas sp. dw_358]
MTTLVIIGAGFSGTVVAIEFLARATAADQVIIVNRSGKMARGLAYGTNSPRHLLNVPAGNMTALVDDPDSFLNYCNALGHSVEPATFVPRHQYGEYLSHLLDQAIGDSSADCQQRVGEVTSVQKDGHKTTVHIAGQPELVADHVVLAFGNFPPARIPGLDAIDTLNHYVPDPWMPLPEAPAEKPLEILLIGSGLTAVDSILEISARHPRARFTLLSRRGLLPAGHRDKLPVIPYDASIRQRIAAQPASAREYLKAVRQEIALHPELWRDVIAALRPITPTLWQALSVRERARFLRHLQPYWDVHRHRLAPATWDYLQQVVSTGKVRLTCGRVLSIEGNNEKMRAQIQPRGGNDPLRLTFDWVINCTGPSTRILKLNSKLIRQLLAAGTIAVDELELGLRVAGDGAIINAHGERLPWISYVGPMLKAANWEATAVPELRHHARALAIRLSAAPPVDSDLA